jgi:hypothetical protein
VSAGRTNPDHVLRALLAAEAALHRLATEPEDDNAARDSARDDAREALRRAEWCLEQIETDAAALRTLLGIVAHRVLAAEAVEPVIAAVGEAVELPAPMQRALEETLDWLVPRALEVVASGTPIGELVGVVQVEPIEARLAERKHCAKLAAASPVAARALESATPADRLLVLIVSADQIASSFVLVRRVGAGAAA